MVTVSGVRFFDEYSGIYSPVGNNVDAAGTPYIAGVVGDRVWVKIDGYVEWSSVNIPANFNNTTNTITRIDCSPGQSFINDGFQVGDTIEVSGTTVNDGTYTIGAVSASTITTIQSIPVTGSYAGVNIYGATPINEIDLLYNIVPASAQNFQSLSDVQSTQQVTFFNGSPNNVSYPGRSLTWVDTTDIGGLPSCNFSWGTQSPHLAVRTFEIIAQIYIKPFSLTGQQTSINNLLTTNSVQPPNYFLGTGMGFACQVNMKFQEGTTHVDQTSQNNTSQPRFYQGKTYWFNEATRSATTVATLPWYTLSAGAKYKDDTTGLPLPAVDLSTVTDVTFQVKGSDFNISPGDYYVLNFARFPGSASDYQNMLTDPANTSLTTDYRKAMFHDRCFTTVNGPSANGDQFGTPYQAIRNITSSVVGGQLNVQFKVDLGSEILDTFNSNLGGDCFYMLWITPQKANVTLLAEFQRTAVLVDLQRVVKNTDDPLIVEVVTNGSSDIYFYQYPNVGVHPLTNFSGKAGEYTYADFQFKVKQNCIINSIGCYITAAAYDTSLSGFNSILGQQPLVSWTNNVSNTFNGQYNNFNISTSAGYYLADGDIRNVRQVYYDDTVNTPGYFGYTGTFGFQFGYRYDIQPANQQAFGIVNNPSQSITINNSIQTPPSVFQPVTTNYWPTYLNNANSPLNVPSGQDVTMYFYLVITVTDPSTGFITQLVQQANLFAEDEYNNMDAGSPSTVTNITSYFDGTFTNPFPGVAQDAPTGVEFQFDGLSPGIIPSPYSAFVVETILVYNDGNTFRYDRSTNQETNLAGSLWVNQPTIQSLVGGSIARIKNVIDLTLLPPGTQSYRMFARLGYKI